MKISLRVSIYFFAHNILCFEKSCPPPLINYGPCKRYSPYYFGGNGLTTGEPGERLQD